MTLTHPKGALKIEIVWDPKARRVEPPNCPQCQIPTFQFSASQRGAIGCPQCLNYTHRK